MAALAFSEHARPLEAPSARITSALWPAGATSGLSNAYDADSRKVEVFFPTDAITSATEVVVHDYGHGMSADEIEDEYLPIGRDRRAAQSGNIKSRSGKRNVTGRKGLGKLSAFGIAEEMEIRAVHDGEEWTLRLNYEEMKLWAKANPGRPYEPTIVEERTGKTDDDEGVEVCLRKLHRTRNRHSESTMTRWPGDASKQRTTFGNLSRSELMSRVRGRGNATTELRAVALLRHERLLGWRRHLAIAGRPDFAWPLERVAVFIDGCFWHGHGCGRNLTPRRNATAWQAKIAANQRRDRRNARALRAQGWSVSRVWECRLKGYPNECARQIKRAVERRRVAFEH